MFQTSQGAPAHPTQRVGPVAAGAVNGRQRVPVRATSRVTHWKVTSWTIACIFICKMGVSLRIGSGPSLCLKGLPLSPPPQLLPAVQGPQDEGTCSQPTPCQESSFLHTCGLAGHRRRPSRHAPCHPPARWGALQPRPTPAGSPALVLKHPSTLSRKPSPHTRLQAQTSGVGYWLSVGTDWTAWVQRHSLPAVWPHPQAFPRPLPPSPGQPLVRFLSLELPLLTFRNKGVTRT